MGRPARPLHDPRNHRPVERRLISPALAGNRGDHGAAATPRNGGTIAPKSDFQLRAVQKSGGRSGDIWVNAPAECEFHKLTARQVVARSRRGWCDRTGAARGLARANMNGILSNRSTRVPARVRSACVDRNGRAVFKQSTDKRIKGGSRRNSPLAMRRYAVANLRCNYVRPGYCKSRLGAPGREDTRRCVFAGNSLRWRFHSEHSA